MQSQLILNYALQFVVLGFVFLMIFDFVNGLLERARQAHVAASVTILPTFEPSPAPVVETIADPWTMDADIAPALPHPIITAPRPQLLLAPAKELPLMVQIETEVRAIAWQQLRKVISDYKLNIKGKRNQLEKRFLEYCQSRNEEQLQTVLEYLRA